MDTLFQNNKPINNSDYKPQITQLNTSTKKIAKFELIDTLIQNKMNTKLIHMKKSRRQQTIPN